MTTSQYVFKITELVRITDGDTFWVRLDTGFRNLHLTNIRLLGVDTAEFFKGSERERTAGRRAKELTTKWFTENLPASAGEAVVEDLNLAPTIWVRTEKDPDSFGRWLGEVWAEFPDPLSREYLADALVNAELATKWPTRWHEVHDPDSTYWNRTSET